jgi:predicted metal-dependent hydrolase
LETAWRRLTGPEKEILQGIILVSAALVHLQKDEPDITLSVMRRAYNKLDPYDGKHFGVEISALRNTLGRMLTSGRPGFFKIEMEA